MAIFPQPVSVTFNTATWQTNQQDYSVDPGFVYTRCVVARSALFDFSIRKRLCQFSQNYLAEISIPNTPPLRKEFNVSRAGKQRKPPPDSCETSVSSMQLQIQDHFQQFVTYILDKTKWSTYTYDSDGPTGLFFSRKRIYSFVCERRETNMKQWSSTWKRISRKISKVCECSFFLQIRFNRPLTWQDMSQLITSWLTRLS